MKYLLSLLIVAFGAVSQMSAQSDAISTYFEKYMDDEKFTMVFVSPKMFQMLDRLSTDDISDPDADIVMDIAKDLRGLRILTTDVDPLKYFTEFKSVMNKTKYEPLMMVRDKGQDINFLINEDGNSIKELLMLVGGKDEFVLLSFVGDIKLDKLSKLAKEISIPGGEHLEKLEDKN